MHIFILKYVIMYVFILMVLFSLIAKYLKLHKLRKKTSINKVQLVFGSDLLIEKRKLDGMIFAARNHCVLVRNLFRYFFSVEEMAKHSLFGAKCNALKDLVVLPEIDPVKRNTIFGKHF